MHRPELNGRTQGVLSERQPTWADDHRFTEYRPRCCTSFLYLPFDPNLVALGSHHKGWISQDELTVAGVKRLFLSYGPALPLQAK